MHMVGRICVFLDRDSQWRTRAVGPMNICINFDWKQWYVLLRLSAAG